MASTEWGDIYGARLAKLTSKSAWCAGIDNQKQWIQVNLRTIKRIYGVVIQGKYECSSTITKDYVKTFKVMYKDIDTKWTFVKEGDSDEDMVSCIILLKIIQGRNRGWLPEGAQPIFFPVSLEELG